MQLVGKRIGDFPPLRSVNHGVIRRSIAAPIFKKHVICFMIPSFAPLTAFFSYRWFSPGLLAGAVLAGASGLVAAEAPSASRMSRDFIMAQTTQGEALPSGVTGASWEEVKNCTYEQRARFSDGVAKLEARVEAQVAELNAKRENMKADPKNWDFAMKEMNEARAYLKSMATEARKANEETWDDRKEKVRLAWERTQEAYGKVKASTTS